MAVHNIDSYFKTKAMEFHQNIYDQISDWNDLENFDERTCKILDSFETPLDQKSNNIIDRIYNTIVTPNVPLIQCCGLYIFTYNHKAAVACKDDKLCDLIETHAVIKVKKGYNSSLSDIIYIDEHARIYESWDDFIQNNELSQCTMYVPKNGIYQANLREIWSEDYCPVWIEKFINNKVCNNIDTVCNVINIGLMGVAIAASFHPIGATINSSVQVGKCISTLWTSGRAVRKLHDRSKHCQSIMPTNMETISSYLGILDNVCIGTYNATSTIMSKALNKGRNVGNSVKFIHNAAIIGNTAFSTSGLVTNSMTFVNNFKKSKKVPFQDALALGINLLLFYNSIVSFQFASELIQSKQDEIINEYQKSLCKKKRRNQFKRLVRKVKPNTNNNIKQNEQIIRSVKKVNNQESFFKFLMGNSLDALSRKDSNFQKILDFAEMLIDNTSLNNDLSRENNSNKNKPSSINFSNINIELEYFRNLKIILASIENFNCTEIIRILLMNGARKFTENKSKITDIAIGFIWKYLKHRLKKWNLILIQN
ncbi:PREDICTED: uncharacterized protein LOC105362374 [Ceratosolen solmsi marchali]|uniref:Uncharacterized protein LOC105362374 n=1 Tax=Ceratosolen solmsi marchali TaxID=326594 RepID=A0AAJ6YHE7_9HYME|nr:PREDICTED: uncharacterized protein LOC105362374 [Ceratosolen solmsi marchali]